MPREQLHALAQDVARLLSAGGRVAVGDEGLRRRAAALRAFEQAVPALGRIAKRVEGVIDAQPARATSTLLDLLLVVQQAQAGLAVAGVEGSLEPVAEAGPWVTNTPVPTLQTLSEHLRGRSSSDDGRQLLSSPAAVDLRLVNALVAALERGPDELADLVAERTLPAFGPAVAADLQRGLEQQPPLSAARRLMALCQVDSAAGLAALCRVDAGIGARVRQTASASGPASLHQEAALCLEDPPSLVLPGGNTQARGRK